MKQFPFAAAAFFLPRMAQAHAGHEQGQFLGGLTHPVTGADHLLAMLALGLLAAQISGRALWALPLTFVGAMVVGGLAGHVGIGVPGVEPMIPASVIILGALVAMTTRLPLPVLVPGVALFGLTHGVAHGAEGPSAGILPYAAGFAIMTMALHLAGIVAAKLLRRGAILRGLGGGAAMAGVALVFGG